MPDITVSVTGTPPAGTYSSSSNKVSSNGDIRVNPGITSIQFVCGPNQAWTFQSPWISFNPAGPFRTPARSRSRTTTPGAARP